MTYNKFLLLAYLILLGWGDQAETSDGGGFELLNLGCDL